MEIAPRRVLLLLTGAVLLAHLVVLQSASHSSLRPGFTPSHKPFTTRMVALAPAPLSAPVPVALPAAANARPIAAPKRPATVAAARPVRAKTPSSPPPATGAATERPAAPNASEGAASNSTVPEEATAAIAPQPPASAPEVPAPAPLATASAPNPAASAPSADQQRLLATRYQVPAPLRIGYDVSAEIKGVPLRAQGELLWQHDGQAYTARLEIKAFLIGSRVQTSAGSITPHALAPTRFSDKTRTEVAAHFRADQGKVTFSANTPDVVLQPMAQDRLSVFMQLAGMLAAEPTKYQPGTSLALQTIGPRSGETWEFTVEADEPLELAGGRTLGRKLVHAPALDFDQKVELWLAPTLGYMPARIRITQADGDFVDLQWRTDGKP